MMLGSRIALLRRGLGLSQAMLAKELNISASALGMYEQGRRSPPQDVLIALSQKLHVSIDYLLTGQAGGQNDCGFLAGLFKDSKINSVRPLLFSKDSGTVIIAVNLKR